MVTVKVLIDLACRSSRTCLLAGLTTSVRSFCIVRCGIYAEVFVGRHDYTSSRIQSPTTRTER